MATPEASPRTDTSASASSVMSSWRSNPPSERGSSCRPCSAMVLSSSCRNETFTRNPLCRATAGMAKLTLKYNNLAALWFRSIASSQRRR